MVPTELSKLALRVRLSLKETQVEFAQRFMVSWLTVHNWETGKSRSCNRLHHQILKSLRARLDGEGRLIPEAAFIAVYRNEIERKDELADVTTASN